MFHVEVTLDAKAWTAHGLSEDVQVIEHSWSSVATVCKER